MLWSIEKGNVAGIGIGAAFLAVWIWGYTKSLEEDRQANELRRHEELRRQEEGRIRRSPEEIDRRGRAAEQLRAEAEERERERKRKQEEYAREKWNEYHRTMRIEEVDAMTGAQFEHFVKTLLERTGHTNVMQTPVTGDQGCDPLCKSPDAKRTVVQTKRWKGPVGNRAVQEVLGAMLYYDAQVALIITNSHLTEPAKQLAAKDERIHLVDRNCLSRMVRQAFPRQAPKFDWEKYNKHVKNWDPPAAWRRLG